MEEDREAAGWGAGLIEKKKDVCIKKKKDQEVRRGGCEAASKRRSGIIARVKTRR